MAQKSHKKSRSKIARSISSGSILSNKNVVHRLPLLGVAALLIIIYMAIGFRVQKHHGYVDALIDDITRLKTVSVTTSAQRQRMTKRDNIEKLMQKNGIKLQDLTAPPRGLKVE